MILTLAPQVARLVKKTCLWLVFSQSVGARQCGPCPTGLRTVGRIRPIIT